MKLVPLHNLFKIKYGNSFDLNVLQVCDKKSSRSVNYVSRTREHNGISAFVCREDAVAPFEKGLITVAGSGDSVLSSFVQNEPFYTGYHVFVLFPKKEMSELEKLFYCYCIRLNQYKYGFGRQANKTLKFLSIPEEMPEEFANINIQRLNTIKREKINEGKIELNLTNWRHFPLKNLFEISSTRDELPGKLTEGNLTPYITSSELNNGITMYVDEESGFGANTITANRGGSVGCFFFQPMNYMATPVDVRILTPKFSINPFNAMFLITILQLEKYRFNYSRKMGTGRLRNLSILLPAKNGKPDFEFMENYIKSLPYSSSI